jgi:hypothetical protein
MLSVGSRLQSRIVDEHRDVAAGEGLARWRAHVPHVTDS